MNNNEEYDPTWWHETLTSMGELQTNMILEQFRCKIILSKINLVEVITK